MRSLPLCSYIPTTQAQLQSACSELASRSSGAVTFWIFESQPHSKGPMPNESPVSHYGVQAPPTYFSAWHQYHLACHFIDNGIRDIVPLHITAVPARPGLLHGALPQGSTKRMKKGECLPGSMCVLGGGGSRWTSPALSPNLVTYSPSLLPSVFPLDHPCRPGPGLNINTCPVPSRL